jgi:hypothetical protein
MAERVIVTPAPEFPSNMVERIVVAAAPEFPPMMVDTYPRLE